MHAPLARLSRARLAVLVAACLTASFAAPNALASRYVVDHSGGGDFTTIQAAIDQQAIGFRDTILVMPGEYAETITPPVSRTALVSAGGAAVTSMHSIVASGYPVQYGYANIDGFTFTQAVSIYEWLHDYQHHYPFVHCVFLGEVNYRSGGYVRDLSISDCDFYARTRLTYFHGRASRLRFHSAPLVASSVGGLSPFVFEDCLFEGPADTLVHIPALSDEGDAFRRCTFSNAKKGIVIEGLDGFDKYVTSCSFSDLSEAGIWLDDTTTWTGSVGFGLAGLSVGDSRFMRCGTGIHWAYWKPNSSGGAYLVRDTIVASAADGILLGPAVSYWGGVIECIVEGSGRHGAALVQNFSQEVGYLYSNYLVLRSRFTGNRGDGLFVQDTVHRALDPNEVRDPGQRWRTKVVHSTFENNGGNGLRIESSTWRVDSCVAFGNSGDGFFLRSTTPEYTNTATRNTSALNQGDGYRFTVRGVPFDSLFFIERNLAAMNAGAGIRVPYNGGLRRFAYNDAWNNYLTQYAAPGSPTDSNLTADPRFCDLSSGAGGLGLQQGSPVGAGGVYGLIGALPEQCANTTAVEPTAPRLSFAVRPTVARGSVEFVPPSFGPDGRVELFDLTGRRLWGAALGPTTGTLRWRGQSETGHAQPGLYWVRFTRAGETQTQRLVWLR